MSDKNSYPCMVAGRVTEQTAAQIAEARARFGVTDGALVRMALVAFLPTYLAAAGRPENIEVAGRVCSALEQNPALRPQLDELLRKSTRARRAA